VGLADVRAAHLMPAVMHVLGQTRNADAADADKMVFHACVPCLSEKWKLYQRSVVKRIGAGVSP